MDFTKELMSLSLPSGDNILNSFEKYYSLLVEWNERFNLTAITEREEVYLKHFLDSVYGAKYLKNGATVADIGAGAGFPSIPLKIVREDLKIDMYDSLNKRITFVEEVINTLGLKNITATHSRIEDLTKKREYYDYVVARAVAPLPTLLEYAIPLIKVGGQLIAYKGSNADEELAESMRALNLLYGKVDKVEKFTLPGSDISRSFIIVTKTKPTDKKYPRGKNKPKTEPLI